MYILGEEQLESSPAERDLGMLVSSRLSRSQQGAWAAKRTNSILEGITSCPNQTVIPLIQPHLEYSSGPHDLKRM